MSPGGQEGCLWRGTLEGTWQLVQFIVHSSLSPWSRLAALHTGQASTAGHVRAQGAFMPQGNPGHKVPLGISKRDSRSVLCDNLWV